MGNKTLYLLNDKQIRPQEKIEAYINNRWYLGKFQVTSNRGPLFCFDSKDFTFSISLQQIDIRWPPNVPNFLTKLFKQHIPFTS